MLMKNIQDKKGELFIDGVSTADLAKKLDTPLYVYSKTKIQNQYRKIKEALDRNLDRSRILYSAKANSNLSILKILEKEGTSLDAVSPGEVYIAKKAGFSPDRIFFTGTSVRTDEMAWLLKEGITINIDSLSQLIRLLELATPPVISVRINPTLGAGHHEHVVTGGKVSKFGLWEDTALNAYERAVRAGVKRFGIQMHIGSGIMNPELFIQAVRNLLDTAGKIRKNIGCIFDFIDIGGGIGVPYLPDEEEFKLDSYSEKISNLYQEKTEELDLGEPELWLELGRFLVAEAGVLLTRVNTVKVTPYRKFAGVDAGFNTLVRPIMYGAYHHILVANRLREPLEVEYDVAGPICESGDLLAKGRMLPTLREGDLLAVLNVGAYGFSMSSEYNSRPRASEVLVFNGHHEVIRKRGLPDDLLSHQKDPSMDDARAC